MIPVLFSGSLALRKPRDLTPWCNGNTSDFGSDIPGSSPGGVVAESLDSTQWVAIASQPFVFCSATGRLPLLIPPPSGSQHAPASHSFILMVPSGHMDRGPDPPLRHE